MRVFSLLSLFLIHLTAAGCEEEARSRGDGPVADTSSRDDSQVGSDLAQDGPAGDGPVSDATVPGDGPVPQDGATTTLEIISPKAGTPLTEGASITLTGKGQ
jgi:hypothetical protein